MIDLGFHEPLNVDGHSVKAEFLNIRRPFFSVWMCRKLLDVSATRNVHSDTSLEAH